MLMEVCKVFVTTDDIINGNTLGYRQKVKIFGVTDVRLGFDSYICDETYIIDHFKEIVSGLGRDEFVEFLTGNDSPDFLKLLRTGVNLHVVMAQHIGQRRKPLANHE